MIKEITIGNKPAELRRVAAFVDELGDELALDGELLMNLNLVLEEMVANIINYAYPQPTDDTIELRAESDGKEIVLTLADRGVAFDPTKRGNLNTDINPAEREIGGMGIFIVKNIMNRVTYQRQNGRNLVTMVKEVKSKSEDMTQILKEGDKTIIKTGSRIDTTNAEEFEQYIQPVLQEEGINLVMDCADLTYMASSGLRIIQKTMRAVMKEKGQFKIVNVNPAIYRVLQMTGFTKFMTIEHTP